MSALALAPEPSPSHAELAIDLSAVAANARTLAGIASGELMAVVKADGFGHGAVALARTALSHGATRLGVTTIREALELRAGGIDAPILSWLNAADADFAAAVRSDVTVAVPSLHHLASAATAGARVHLQLDTGMARDGAAPEEWPLLCQAARRAELRGRLVVEGIMGHLPCGEDPDAPATRVGRTRFEWALRVAHACGLRPRDRHLASTAATIADPRTHHTMSRVGAGLVGIDPTGTVELRPAMRLAAPLISVRTVRAGTGVGYGHTWTAPGTTRLGLLPVGYADGLPRLASNRAEVQVHGRRCAVVGRISMDMTVIDLGPVSEPEVPPGTTAVIFGPGGDGEPTVADWAGWSDTIEHEIVTGLGPRLHRTVHSHLRGVGARG